MRAGAPADSQRARVASAQSARRRACGRCACSSLFSADQTQLIATVKLALQPAGRPIVGELVPARLSITVASTWSSSSPSTSSEVRLLYDIVTSSSDWLITGRKRAEIRIAPDRTSAHHVELALMPMRAGRLTVPGVVVSALPAGGSTSIEMFHSNAAETVEVVPEQARATFTVDLNAPPSILAPS